MLNFPAIHTAKFNRNFFDFLDFQLRPEICVNYFLSFYQKNLSPEKI